METRNAYGFPVVVCDFCKDPLGTVIVRELRGNLAFDFHYNCYQEFRNILQEKTDEKKTASHYSPQKG